MRKLTTLIVGSVALFAAADLMAQTCKGPQPSICVRSCWGARAASCSSIAALTRAIIHHTAGAGEYTTDLEVGKSKVRGVQNYHMDVQGWCDVGYHFLFNAGGHIYEGRVGSMSSLPRGAHDACNDNSFGFSNLGYYHPPYNQTYTAAQKNANEACIAWRMPSGWNPSGSSTYCGNSVFFVDGHYKVVPTACPGDIIIPQLGSVRSGVIAKRSCSTGKTARDVDNSSGGFSVTGTWSTGSSSTDKFGADYRFHSTAPVSEPAQWATTLNTTATWNVKAWWPQGANRSTTAPYIVTHGGGTTTVNKNQQVNGGSWQLLGSWSMGGAINTKLSCWTGTGFVVVADAIRWD
jgi:hypothetical protein